LDVTWVSVEGPGLGSGALSINLFSVNICHLFYKRSLRFLGRLYPHTNFLSCIVCKPANDKTMPMQLPSKFQVLSHSPININQNWNHRCCRHVPVIAYSSPMLHGLKQW
jgi:hypothetical protein